MYALQIIRIVAETKNAKTFVLRLLNNIVIYYKSGQFLTLIFETKFGEKRRSFSISSSPDNNEPLSITIKRAENGEFSRLLTGHARGGDILYTSGISGLFHLPEKIENIDQLFFFAAGSGITPCYAMIKTLLATTQKPVILIYSNKRPAEAIFYDQLLLLQQQYPQQLQVRFLFSSAADIYNSRLSNWLLRQLLQQYLTAEKSRALFYLCGPFDYMQMIVITLLSEGIPLSNIRKENFSDLPRLINPAPPDKMAHPVTIHFKNKAYLLIVQYPQTILMAAKAAGIPIPYSCEAGRCGSCAATCVKGKIWMAYNEVLMDDEIEKGRILCCQSYPVQEEAEIIVDAGISHL